MSEVDRLSTSGSYPALALADRRRPREERQPPRQDAMPVEAARKEIREPPPDPPTPRNPSSLIDEYA